MNLLNFVLQNTPLVASGLDALILPFALLNLKKDSEIIVPANTFIATIIVVLLAWTKKPIFVEPNAKLTI